jgi:nucleotide-binding universal stress UspA family protein
LTKTCLQSREETMNAIRKILVPTDFSPHADEAFRVAHMLARALGAEVVLFHIAQPPAVVLEGGRFVADPGKGISANLWDRFEVIQPADPKVRVDHQVIVAERPNVTHILEILEKLGCDLIVMGTHGRSWLKHLLFGSVTEAVVRRAHCPVMVVKSPAHKAAMSAPPASKKAEDHHAG